RNVEKLAPGLNAEQWLAQRGGGVQFDDYWWSSAQMERVQGARRATTVPRIYIDTDLNEFEAAKKFIDLLTNSSDVGANWRASAIASSKDPGAAYQDFEKWWLKKAADAAVNGVEGYLAVVSIVNEGADWAITVSDVTQGNWWSLAALLPFVSAGAIAILSKNGDVLFKLSDDAVRYYNHGGELGRGFASHDELVEFLGRAGKNKTNGQLNWHHIVEQHAENMAKFGAEAVHNTANVIALPADMHVEITAFYGSTQELVTGSATMTVREWIKSKSYREQYDFGVKVFEFVVFGKPL
ncbi:MAG: hypothetical protein ACREHD_26635, partial [Pirellulales bacterium]